MLWPTLATVLILLMAACASQAPGADMAGRFHAQLDEDWKYWVTQYPEMATVVGYPGQDTRWTDYSPAAIDARNRYLHESLTRLKSGVDPRSLPAADQVTFDLYLDILETAVQGLAFHNDANPVKGVVPHNLYMPINQIEGIQQDIPRTIAFMPTATREDYDRILTRLSALGPLVDQTIALMRHGLLAKMTPPKIAMRDLPDQVLAQLADEDPLKSPMLVAFSHYPSSIPAAERDTLTARAVDTYRESIGPSFTRLHKFLVSDYLPACRESIDARSLPDGDEMYAYNIRWHTTSDLTPQQIHEKGLAEVARIHAEMDRVMKDAKFNGTYDAFKTFLRTSPQFYFKDADSLLAAYRDIAKRADSQLPRLFGRLPQTTYGVKAVPAAIAPSQTTAYYDQGSFAAGRPGTMFANTYKLDSRPKWEMEALTLHEAVPGHHVQISLAQETPGLAEFRKNSSYTAFVEGWALYAESLGDDMGFYQDPYSKFGQLTYDMWRAVRLVVDTGIHSMGWSRQQAIDYFRANAAKTEQDITVEVDRYIVWPGQALGYKIGQLKIRELRTKAESSLGSKFDVRGFHDTVLGQGAVPLNVLDRQVSAWVAKAGGK